MVTTSAPQNAAQNPRTWKPSPSALDTELVSMSISPLMTSVNSPSVTIRMRKRQDQRDRPQDRVDDAEHQRDAEQRQRPPV